MLPSPFAAWASEHLRGRARSSQDAPPLEGQASTGFTHPRLTTWTNPAPRVTGSPFTGTTWGPRLKIAEPTRLEAKLVPPPATTGVPGVSQYTSGIWRQREVAFVVGTPPPLPPLQGHHTSSLACCQGTPHVHWKPSRAGGTCDPRRPHHSATRCPALQSRRRLAMAEWDYSRGCSHHHIHSNETCNMAFQWYGGGVLALTAKPSVCPMIYTPARTP